MSYYTEITRKLSKMEPHQQRELARTEFEFLMANADDRTVLELARILARLTEAMGGESE